MKTNPWAVALWILGAVMLALGVVFNNAGQTGVDGASLIQGMLGTNLMTGGLLVWGLAMGLSGYRWARAQH